MPVSLASAQAALIARKFGQHVVDAIGQLLGRIKVKTRATLARVQKVTKFVCEKISEFLVKALTKQTADWMDDATVEMIVDYTHTILPGLLSDIAEQVQDRFGTGCELELPSKDGVG